MSNATKSIPFVLVPKDGWPPANVEHLWMEQVGDGCYKLRSFPLFVKGVAYEDVLKLTLNESGSATSWETFAPSRNSLLWIFEREPADVMERLADLGCGFESGAYTGLYSVNVPPGVTGAMLDGVLQEIEEAGKISVAYPVVRFPD